MSTIFALATGQSRAAIAILRLTGPDVPDTLTRLAGAIPPPRRAALRPLRAADGSALDHGVVISWPGPQSYTGEDYAELHVHGGAAVLEAVTAALLEGGLRPAEPGEFTRRAFLNGKMDLLAAEAVADLISAETQAQRALALRQLDGEQSLVLSAWAERLKRLLAWQEALIDFPDDGLPDDIEFELNADIVSLGNDIDAAAGDALRAARTRDGVTVAISGAPNVGKSSLINALCEREVAITSPFPGTTRDALEARIELGGVMVTLIDTAGLRDTVDPVEAEGVRRARERADTADLVLQVVQAGQFSMVEGQTTHGLVVANKVDLAAAPPDTVGVSARTGEGIAALREALRDGVLRLTRTQGHAALGRARHRAALLDAAGCLRRAADAALPELRGEEIRLAMRALGRITGAVDVEDVLATIFSAFCIGK